MSDIRAGGAYVEIGAKSKPLEKGLNEARKKLEDFGKGMETVGRRIGLVGAAAATGFIGAAKHVADLANKTANMQAKTSMSLKGIATLGVVSRESGIGMEALSMGVKGMQNNIASGGKEAQATFARLGTSMQELSALSPEQALGLLADQLLKVSDANERGALAESLFGKAGRDMLAAMSDGSAGLDAAGRSADRFGLALSKGALEAGLKADKAFAELAHSLEGLVIAVGNGVIPVLVPMLDRITEVVNEAKKWISVNGETIQTLFKVSVGVAGLGVGIALLGAAIAAAMSPLVLATVGIAGIGMALLSVLDVLGVTDTGFGDLFNSIRVGGTGLATWLAAFWIWMEKGWTEVTGNISIIWEYWKTAFASMWRGVYEIVLGVVESVVSTWQWAVNKIGSFFNSLIGFYNDIAEEIGASPIEFRFKTSGKSELAEAANKARWQNEKAFLKTSSGMGNEVFERDKRQAQLSNEMKNLFRKDPQDDIGFGVKTDKLKTGFEKLGTNISDAMEEMLSRLMGRIKGKSTGFEPSDSSAGAGGAFTGPKTRSLGDKVSEAAKTNFSAVGTFSGFAGGQLAANGVFTQQLMKLEDIAGKLGMIVSNTNNLKETD